MWPVINKKTAWKISALVLFVGVMAGLVAFAVDTLYAQHKRNMQTWEEVEVLPYEAYHTSSWEKSKIDPEKNIWVGHFICPRCKSDLKNMNYGDVQTCPKCNLRMKRSGDDLHCMVQKETP